jgi:hypothetical protein
MSEIEKVKFRTAASGVIRAAVLFLFLEKQERKSAEIVAFAGLL